ncbi:hypothetical protein [Acetobacterium woodii]|uniref:Chloroplast import component protein (Tic20) n=1 Tax=Acetobacterium woodii (strain ATCC 29683 / DSM 1030 / JCM 2381 / KCTC 1655 / WB1) TaxID=931626 RepID=H6LGR4_ACEWD|nr:hypothetical protein [Acetobacterium woodii]AFA49578.1 hypothetical protein Awo_c28270 [Acetobacterium woodii DSM 1030]
MDNIDKQEAEEGRVMAIMAYIIFLIPIFFGKGNRFVQYHTNQGLILFLAYLALTAIGAVIGMIPIVGWIMASIIFNVAPMAFLCFAIYGIINVIQLEVKPIPYIGQITLIKSY